MPVSKLVVIRMLGVDGLDGLRCCIDDVYLQNIWKCEKTPKTRCLPFHNVYNEEAIISSTST